MGKQEELITSWSLENRAKVLSEMRKIKEIQWNQCQWKGEVRKIREKVQGNFMSSEEIQKRSWLISTKSGNSLGGKSEHNPRDHGVSQEILRKSQEVGESSSEYLLVKWQQVKRKCDQKRKNTYLFGISSRLSHTYFVAFLRFSQFSLERSWTSYDFLKITWLTLYFLGLRLDFPRDCSRFSLEISPDFFWFSSDDKKLA